jgi:hypothetical protein
MTTNSAFPGSNMLKFRQSLSKPASGKKTSIKEKLLSKIAPKDEKKPTTQMRDKLCR